LRLAFGGAVIVMFAMGIVVSLALLRTIGKDVLRQQAIVESRITATDS
jgi:hypothetical protein